MSTTGKKSKQPSAKSTGKKKDSPPRKRRR